jgi:hypothetical protein
MCVYEDSELPKIDYDNIKIYPEMSYEIINLLKMRDDDLISMYAAKLIEELLKRGTK